MTSLGRRRWLAALGVLVAALGAGVPAAAEIEKRSGILTQVWGDPEPGSGLAAQRLFQLTADDGRTVELEISDALARLHGGLHDWSGRRVEVTVEVPRHDPLAISAEGPSGRPPLAVRALRSLDGGDGLDRRGSVTGSQPWVSILCKFQDIGAEPEDLAFFQGMYADQPGGLDHYWQELSYGVIDVAGSLAVDWVVLPNPQSFYVPTPGSGTGANLGLLFDHCTAAADPFVDFGNGGEPFVGINMMFNGLLDCCAWGGSRFATLDGITKSWRVTWEPPWAYADEGVIAHEMGHGFGLPHSNNWDGDSSPYDSPWDVMSSATGYAVDDSTYGRLGKHTLAYHKDDRLGWIAAEQIFEVPGPGSTTLTLDHMALATTGNFRIARIPVDGSNRFYTVEVRKRVGDYDGALPGDAVILCEVDPGRQQPAWTVDSDVPPADYGDNEGTMWKVGETFTDAEAGITVSVISETTDGFVVTITSALSLIFSDGFESGDTSNWSATSP